MRFRIHHPLFAGFIGVVGLLVTLIVLLVGTGMRRELRAAFEDELERNLALAEAVVAGRTGVDPHALSRELTDLIGYRITFISESGDVIGDSYVDPARVSEVVSEAGRPEVQAVLSGSVRTSFAERSVTHNGAAQLFGARRAEVEGETVVLRIAAPQTDIETTVGRVQRTVALTGLLAMVLALVAAYGVSVAFARPLVALADRARRLTEGDFTSTVPYSRVAELQDVAIAFNRLTDELRARLSELGRERDGMQTLIDCMAEGVVALTDDARLLRTNRSARALLDIPDGPRFAPIGAVIRHPDLRDALKDSVTKPEQSREIVIGGRSILLASRALDSGGAVTTLLDITELRRMERVRSDFVANASHELKTPLTSIRGYAEALAEDDPPEGTRRQFLSSILNNTLRLQRLVDDLLDLSRLESGGWSANIESVDVGEVVQEAWGLVSAETQVDRTFSMEGEAVALGDGRGLVQVFRNLLENAVRHTEPGGTIRVEVRRRDSEAGDSVEIAVEDDGEGIPAQSLPRVFERFYRADSSRARDFGGTGLGLAIVKHWVGAMDGSVSAESDLGYGTRVTVRLPAA
jgi:signal transduction histidine kinase